MPLKSAILKEELQAAREELKSLPEGDPREDELYQRCWSLQDQIAKALADENARRQGGQAGQPGQPREIRVNPNGPPKDDFADLEKRVEPVDTVLLAMGEARGGAAKEYNDEVIRMTGRAPRGAYGSTDPFLQRSEMRSQLGEGDYLVPGQYLPQPIRIRRPLLRTEQAGATVIRDRSGPLTVPKVLEGLDAYWVSENEAPPKSDLKMGSVSMKARTISAQTGMTRRVIISQNRELANQLLRDELGFPLRKGLDGAAIAGDGVTEPLGVLSLDLTPVTAQSQFSNTTAELIAELETRNVEPPYAFMINGHVAKAARQTLDAENRVIPMSELFHGVPVFITEQVPSNLGTGGDESAIIIGRWEDLVIGYWSALDIMADPYTEGSKGNIRLYAFLDVDTMFRHETSFAFSQSNSF